MTTATERRQVGCTGLAVSLLSLGTAPLADLYSEVPEEQAIAVIHTSLECGLNYFDTAPHYGAGLAEERLGIALTGTHRDQVVISTKVGRLLTPDGERIFDFSRDGVLRSLETSLKRLNTDYVDILHIHDPDAHYEEALNEAYPVLADLRSQGVIKAVGAGMNQWEMLDRFVHHADFDCFMLAGRYSLLEQQSLAFMDRCAEEEIGILLGGVYNSGILATGARPGAKYDYRDAPADIMARVRRIEEICAQYDVPLPALSIQYPLGHPAINSLVIGTSSPKRLRDNIRALETEIPAALWTELLVEGLVDQDAPLPQVPNTV